MGYTNLVTFVDDGISGVTMDRPHLNVVAPKTGKVFHEYGCRLALL